jgi:formylglycine-generating enzyme required for sulfatase activity
MTAEDEGFFKSHNARFSWPTRSPRNGCPTMVVLPAGRFMMGSARGEGRENEHPQHDVSFGKTFAVAKYEVTIAEWEVRHRSAAENSRCCPLHLHRPDVAPLPRAPRSPESLSLVLVCVEARRSLFRHHSSTWPCHVRIRRLAPELAPNTEGQSVIGDGKVAYRTR